MQSILPAEIPLMMHPDTLSVYKFPPSAQSGMDDVYTKDDRPRSRLVITEILHFTGKGSVAHMQV